MMTQVDIDNDDLTLDEIIQTVKQQLQVETSKEVLIRKLSVFVKYGNNPFFRYLPYFIKKFLLKIGYRLLARRVSTVITSYSIHYTKLYDEYAHDEAHAADTPAVVRMSGPRFGARAKAETRLARFLEEGRILDANRAATALFGSAEGSAGISADAFFGEGRTAFLSEVLMAKGVGETVETASAADGKAVSCQVFSMPDVITSYSIHYTKLYERTSARRRSRSCGWPSSSTRPAGAPATSRCRRP